MVIPVVALGGAEGKKIVFHGILERTEEEMVELRPEVQKRGPPLPYYEEPYVSAPVLPNARRRYRAATHQACAKT